MKLQTLYRPTRCFDAGRSEDQIPMGARFYSLVQNGPGAHPASYTMGAGSFPSVSRPMRGVNHPTPPSAEVKERIGLYFCSSLCLHGRLYGELYLLLLL